MALGVALIITEERVITGFPGHLQQFLRIGQVLAHLVPGLYLTAQVRQLTHHLLGSLRVAPDLRLGRLLVQPGNLNFFAG